MLNNYFLNLKIIDMKEKVFIIIKLYSFIIILTFLLASCERELYEQPTNTSFSSEVAKDWYYNSLKNSEQFRKLSEIKGGKLPDWNNGVYRKTGTIEIIEFPLIKAKKQIAFPSTGKLNPAEVKRVLDASLTRVLFIKVDKKDIVMRELNYIPDYQYLQNKGFDISEVNLSKEKNDFTGAIHIKTWDSQLLSTRILKNGKVLNTIDFNIQSKINKSNATSKINACELYEVVEYIQYCDGTVYGDTWTATGTCSPWEPTGNVFGPYEVCDNSQNECEFSSNPNCECEMYGLGCNNNPPVDPPKTPCENAVSENNSAKTRINNPIVNDQVSLMTQSIATDTNEKSFVFGIDSNGQYQTSAINTGGSSSVSSVISNLGFTPEGIAHTHTADLYDAPSTGDIYQLSESNAYNSNIDYQYTFAADGSKYVLTITNQNDFDFFSTAYPKNDYYDVNTHGWKERSSIDSEFNAVKEQMLNLGKSDDESFEIATAFVLQNHNMGITLNKMDNNGNFISIFVNAYTDPSDPTKTIYTKTTNCNLN